MMEAQQAVLPEEQSLLKAASAGTQDHDLETYVEKLDVILATKIQTLTELRQRVTNIKQMMLEEERMARRGLYRWFRLLI